MISLLKELVREQCELKYCFRKSLVRVYCVSHENAEEGRSNNINCPLLLRFTVGQILIQVRLAVGKLNQLKTDG